MLHQQAIGITRITIPILFLTWAVPGILYTTWGKLCCAAAAALFICYRVFFITKNQADVLRFVPTGNYKEELEKAVTVCGLEPNAIRIRYGYTNEAIALTMFNTISLDPLLWQSIEHDPEALKAKEVLELYVRSIPEAQKNRLTTIRTLLSADAQKFIFKHELAHVYYNFSYKKIMVMVGVGFIAILAGIMMAMHWLPLLGSGAVIIGMVVGGIIDLVLTYASNYFFKAYQERMADLFAAHYSAAQEIEAAAEFFEKHQELLDVRQPELGILAKIPSVILIGYPHGKTRAVYLRNLAAKKHEMHRLV